jgi:hypothetical protein
MTFSANLRSVDKTASERNWPPKRVRKLIAEGLPFVLIGRQKFINSETLDQFLKNREKRLESDSSHSNSVEPRWNSDGGRE